MKAREKKKEKDAIDLMLDQIDFHGMTAKELAGEDGLVSRLISMRYQRPAILLREWEKSMRN